jgi:hypothetical protein
MIQLSDFTGTTIHSPAAETALVGVNTDLHHAVECADTCSIFVSVED